MSTPNPVYSEDWPKIAVTLDYRGGLRYWAVVVEEGGAILPSEMDAFTRALVDAEAACYELQEKLLGRIREARRDKTAGTTIGAEPRYLGEK